MKKTALTMAVLMACNGNVFAETVFGNEEPKKNYYVRSKGYSSNPDSEPPGYVYQLNQTGIEEFKDIDWIDLGLNYRMRFEHRKNDYRRSENRTDNVFLSRTQAYFGIKNIIDPFRFAVELQDSRRHNSKFPKATRDVNKLDIFQAYAELYFKEPGFIDRPISLRAGRMAYEVLDRKLLSRDDWGNTGTNFDGFRAIIGEKEDDWQIDTFALQPMVKEMEEVDNSDKNRWLYGAILNWRRWSDIATLQPFYFRLDKRNPSPTKKIKLHSPGLRFYGSVGEAGFDYDFIGTYQFGDNEGEDNNAYGYATEIGYRFINDWKPRISMVYGYASGDKNPNDNKNQRFERLYGFNRPWSNSNHIEWENLKALKSRIEFSPHKKLKMEGSYSYYWLASKTDSWERANLRDSSGSSGDEIGRDLDFRAHYKLTKYVKTTLGYAHFIPGDFTKRTGRNGTSDFIYLEVTLNAFGNK
ncbi:MAG: hypothetical protein K0R25_226 [Rickettsiaceae bacterium]|jgi:hypothetical protein|nr:hypothetical protein [Rickettsiaceae bacterium]